MPPSEGAAPLEGRTVLVTGATRGIGAACARKLASVGAAVVLMARTESKLESLAEELGGRALPVDLGAEESVRAAVEGLLGDGVVPDVVVNAAGVFDLEPLSRASVETLDRNLRVNLRGAFLLVRSMLPSMLARESGLIVNVGSVAGRKAFPGNGAYSASKFGLRGLHEVLLEEIRGSGVRATLLEPGAVDTTIWDPMAPDARDDLPSRRDMLSPDEVANAVLFVCDLPQRVQVPYLPLERA